MKPEPLPRGILAANGLIVFEGLLRVMRAAGDTYGHDYEAILIYWSVIVASVGRYLRNDDQAKLIESEGAPLPGEENTAWPGAGPSREATWPAARGRSAARSPPGLPTSWHQGWCREACASPACWTSVATARS